jgi:hypothetical protein
MKPGDIAITPKKKQIPSRSMHLLTKMIEKLY